MKKIIWPLLFLIFYSSCATLVNGPYVVTQINSTPDSALIIINTTDTICCTNKPIILERNNADVKIQLIKEDLTKEIILKRKLSFAFWANIFAGPGMLGMAIDYFASPKKTFTYDKKVFVNLLEPDKFYKTWQVEHNVPINFTLSIPYINHFNLRSKNGYISKAGFLGISGGLEYYLNKQYYLSFEAGAAIDFLLPFPVPVDYDSEHEFIAVQFLNFKLNKKIHRTHLGMGLALDQSKYRINNYDTISGEDIREKYTRFGASLSLQYNVKRNFYIGTIYQPMLYDYTSETWDYQHFLTFQLIYKIKLWQHEK